MTERMPQSLDTKAKKDRFKRVFLKYLKSCDPSPAEESKKQSVRLPNLAGFCRFLGCGIAQLEELCKNEPELYGWICASLEDALITLLPSPSLLSYYLKKRLGYDGQSAGGVAASCGEVRLIFDHDIEEDGA
ncbi:MAG: hypothetical protein IJW50_01425 [Clostridia bacterium]|nr:hypothetical protein [Clostridia bacterium]